MKNVKIEARDGKLVLVIDLTKQVGMSKSGKMKTIATTGGPVMLAGIPELEGLRLAVNVHRRGDD